MDSFGVMILVIGRTIFVLLVPFVTLFALNDRCKTSHLSLDDRNFVKISLFHSLLLVRYILLSAKFATYIVCMEIFKDLFMADSKSFS